MTNTQKHHSSQSVFHRQARPPIDQQSSTSGIVHARTPVTNSNQAGATRIPPLNVERESFDISRDSARLPASPKQRRPDSAPTQAHLVQQGRGHSLHNGQGVSPTSPNSHSAVFLGTRALRPAAQANTQTIEGPGERGVPIDPDSAHSSQKLVERPRGGVRQDKARLKSARTASRQSALDTHVSRAQLTNNKVVRLQSVAGKQKLVQVTLWVDPAVKEHLERRAREEGLSLSPAGAAFLRKAVQQDTDLQYSTLLRPIIEDAIARQMAGIATRLTWLLVRIAFDAGQTRSLVTNILGRQQGVTQPLLKTILESSGRSQRPTSCGALPTYPSL